MIHTFMGASAQVADYEMKKLYDSLKNNGHYMRIVKELNNPKAIPEMDDASDKALKYLVELGNETVKENDSKIKRFAKILINNKRNN